MDKLFHLTDRQTRSICPENLTGGKGCGAMTPPELGSAAASTIGMGWKVNPYVIIQPGETFTMADIEGSGVITHIWLTTGVKGDFIHDRRLDILRMYWDDSEIPSVECPLGDFFATGWGEPAQISSLAVCVNPGSGFNSYWKMPFRRHARITLENRNNHPLTLYYQVTYDLCPLPEEIGYFHAYFNRVNPLPYKQAYTILERIEGRGQYVGTYMAWQVNNSGWWGEGEIKFYMDGDDEFPTICGTGTEDYFCGSYDFDRYGTRDAYLPFTTPYTGLQVLPPDQHKRSQMRFGMYRWHIGDSIAFSHDLRVTIQALGWRKTVHQYLPLQDDIASVAFFYLDRVCQQKPTLPDDAFLEII